jgi:Zn-dependent protease
VNTGSAFRLGAFRGIPIFLHWSLAIIFLLLTWSIASGFSPDAFPELNPGTQWLIGAVTAALFILSVLAHELGHALVAQRLGVEVRRITLLVFGGVAELAQDTDNARAELRIAAAGPIVSFVLSFIFFVAGLIAAAADLSVVQAPLLYLGVVNLLLAVFNLIPGFPLDGGRILRAIVWQRTGSKERADLRAAQSGQLVGFGFFGVAIFLILTGQFLSGVWLLAIGWFIQNSAGITGAQSGMNSLLGGVTAQQAMDDHIRMVMSRHMLRQIVDERVLGMGERFFVVTDGQSPIGVLSLSDIVKIPRERWDWVPAGQVMVPWSRVHTIDRTTPILDALQRMAETGVSQLPVVGADGRPVGVLSREMIVENMRLRSQLRTGIERSAQVRQRTVGGR